MSASTHWLDAADQAQAVKSGAAELEDLVRNGLSQVDSYESALNCLVSDRREVVFAELARIPHAAPFRGVPAVIKDLSCGVSGEPMWNGNRVLKREDVRADHDALVVRRLRAGGFTILARANTAEFGATITTEPNATGSTRNPWDPRLTPGGSSGGSAAAVAAGYAPVAHGTDASGSVRIPASACGILGFKPTNGAIPLDPAERGGWYGLSTPGILARSTRDLMEVFQLLAHQGARLESHQPRRGAGLRIAVLDPAGPLTPDVSAALSETAQRLTELGHKVETASPAFMEDRAFHRQFITLVSAGLTKEIGAWEEELGVEMQPEDLDPATLDLLTLGRTRSAADVDAALAWRGAYGALVDSWWTDGPDVLVTPVLARAHADIGWFSDPDEGGSRVRGAMQFTAQFNVAGNPAISVPLHQTPAGLPVGTQLVGRRGGDGTLLALARDLERAVNWPARHPPLEDLAPLLQPAHHRAVSTQKGSASNA